MASKWPWPRDTPEARLRRIIESYRVALREVAPYACHVVDARMCEFGESWLCESPVDTDACLTADQVYRELGYGFEPHQVSAWGREAGLQVGTLKNGKALYRLGDILTHQLFKT